MVIGRAEIFTCLYYFVIPIESISILFAVTITIFNIPNGDILSLSVRSVKKTYIYFRISDSEVA